MSTNRALPVFTLVLFAICVVPSGADPTVSADSRSEDVSSRLIKTAAGDQILVQDVWIDAPVSKVWEAFSTEKGWTAWSAPVAKIDLRAGGSIRTHYTPDATIGDPGTIVLHIVNYVPERLLTLRAELSDRWPEVIKEDAGRLMNVIVFERITDKRTHIISYGVGYRDTPAYTDLLNFFMPANEGLYRKLKEVLEASSRRTTPIAPDARSE